MQNIFKLSAIQPEFKKHPKCKGYYDSYNMEFDCGYHTLLECEVCKYGLGRKNPEAKCNQIK